MPKTIAASIEASHKIGRLLRTVEPASPFEHQILSQVTA